MVMELAPLFGAKCIRSYFKVNPYMEDPFTTLNGMNVGWGGIPPACCQLSAVNNPFTASWGLSS